MTQLLEGNAASLAEIKDQNRGNAKNLAEMLYSLFFVGTFEVFNCSNSIARKTRFVNRCS